MPSTVAYYNVDSRGEKTSQETGKQDLFSSVAEQNARSNSKTVSYTHLGLREGGPDEPGCRGFKPVGTDCPERRRGMEVGGDGGA